jgi:hypothetical protein
MENLVGQKVPNDKEVASIIKLLESADAQVAKFVDVHLSPEARKGMLRFRPGGEKIATLVGRLASEKGVALPHENVDDMNADLALLQQLRPLLSAAQSLLQRIDDGLLEAESECWSAVTGLYSVLSSMAARDPQLATALRPATDFFATGRRKPKPAPTSK